ncbi:MAG: sirohydrochlorin chelatase [Planctomycetes bacterium]|nr:sirohydrochlorin chelatase [Planctomycetota bacterium]
MKSAAPETLLRVGGCSIRVPGADPARPALALIGHGSRDPEGNVQFADFARTICRRLGRDAEVGFIDHAEPTLDDALAAAAEGARALTVMPVILFAAGHVKTDVPEAVARLKGSHPRLPVRVAAHVGIHDDLVSILEDRICAQIGEACCEVKDETAILLMGRGSSDPDANGDCVKLARLLWERARFSVVETCFIGITDPRLPAGLARCARLGAKRIVVVPWLLFTGILHKRVATILESFRQANPGIEVVETAEIGPDDRLLNVVVRRIADAEAIA